MQDEFSRLLKYARKDAHLTQKQLAALLGVATGTVQQWELGLRFPRPEMLEKLEDKLGVCFLFCNADTAKENERILNSLGEPENIVEVQQTVEFNIQGLTTKENRLFNELAGYYRELNTRGMEVVTNHAKIVAGNPEYQRTGADQADQSEGGIVSPPDNKKPPEEPNTPTDGDNESPDTSPTVARQVT